MAYRLLDRFASLFAGVPYLHRRSNQGDIVATELLEDIIANRLSDLIAARVNSHRLICNRANKPTGIRARRGDGTFGETVPNALIVADEGYQVARGQVATVEIGIEVKVLSKAMMKQIDRVTGDLQKQVSFFRMKGGNPVTVGIVGINHADRYLSFEGDNRYLTDGKRYRHPAQEADSAERRLESNAATAYDEFLVLGFRATNEPPYPFEWIDESATNLNYGASLVRIALLYEARFPKMS